MLCVVGIVAVLLLIVGGMRYITAAGNQAAISDAKDIITNALVALLLAILSWVIVAEINPDVLYIKKPSGEFAATIPYMHGLCFSGFDGTLPPGTECTCLDGTIIGAESATNCDDNCRNGMASFDAAALGTECTCRDGSTIGARSEEDCENKCKVLNHCGLPEPYPCVEALQENVISESGGICHCVDGMDVLPSDLAITAGSYCNEICSDTTLAKDLKYHGISWNLKVGHDVNATLPAEKGKNFTVEVDRVAYYDLSGINDCKGNLVHFAVNFTGVPTFPGDILDEWCCMDMNPACGGSWGSVATQI